MVQRERKSEIMGSQVVSQKFTTGTFSFTGANINSLESTEYTLTGIALDISGSISGQVNDLQNGLKSVVQSCQKSPRSDNLMIRLLTFGQYLHEIHGFKELNKCVLSDYDHVMDNLEGATALYDASVDIIESVSKYGIELYKEDYTANGLVVVLTDGLNNHSAYTAKTVGNKLREAVGEKSLSLLFRFLSVLTPLTRA